MTEQKRTREDIKRERQQQKRKTKKPVGKWLKRIILTIVLLGVIGLVSGVGVFSYYVSKMRNF